MVTVLQSNSQKGFKCLVKLGCLVSFVLYLLGKCVSVNLSVENVFDWIAIDRSFKMRLNVCALANSI